MDQDRRSSRNAPIVTAAVLSRVPYQALGIPSVDFALQIDGGSNVVHARGGGHLVDKVPAVVRFHYNGDASREVLLFEYEKNPFWPFVMCWGVTLMCLFLLRLKKMGFERKKVDSL